jgi:hypothetical protein
MNKHIHDPHEPREVSDRLRGWLNDRGITRPELVADFEDFTTEERLRALFPDDLASNQARDLSKKINHLKEHGGAIIHRHPPPGFSSLTPEIKPWVEMQGRKRVHYHGEPTDEPLYNPESGKQLHPIQVETPHGARFHIGGKWHKGENRDEVHVEVPPQKYTLLATAKVRKTRKHTHRKMYEQNSEKFYFHLLKQHAFGRVPELDEPHDVSYLEAIPGDHKAIDIPRPAVPLLKDAQLIHLVLEGPTKTRSLLEEILEQGTRESVCGILSVSMGAYDELERFVFLFGLRGRHFMIWVDSDGRDPSKPEVIGHAKNYQGWLEKLGCKADIAVPLSPPAESSEDKWGLDDLRGQGFRYGLSLDDSMVLGECKTPNGLSEWVTRYKSSSYTNWRSGVSRDEELLEYLARRAHPGTGDVPLPPLRTIARGLGWDRNERGREKRGHMRVWRGLRSLAGQRDERGKLGPGAMAIDVVRGSLGIRRNYFSGQTEYVDPAIVNVHPDLRATHEPDWPLGDLRRKLRAKKKGKTQMSTATAQQLDRIELRQSMQGEKLDHHDEKLDHILSVLLAFQGGETPRDEWEDWLKARERGEAA